MELTATDALPRMLTRLKLTAIRDQLDILLDEASRRDLTLRETLALLGEREIARKDERRKTISCTTYSQSDGMLSAACTCAFQPSGCMTRDGRLLFPTLKGVAVLRPDGVAVDSLLPPVFIEEVAIGEKVQELSPDRRH